MLTAVVCIGLHSGCATAPRQVDPETLEGVKRITVISLLGEEIDAKYVGFTMFGNKEYVTEPLGWNLNEKTIEVAFRALEGNGFELVGSDYDYSGMWEKYRNSQESYSTRVSEYYGNDTTTPLIQTELQGLVDDYQVDGILLLVPGHEGRYCQGGEPCIGYGNQGYGIHDWGPRGFHAYFSARLNFIPMDTLEPAAQTHANDQVLLQIDEWREDFSAYDSSETEQIRASLYEAAELAIPEAIQKMGLTAQ